MSESTQQTATPRTDAEVVTWDRANVAGVSADFARTLERELVELKAATGLCEKHQTKSVG